MKSEYQAAGMEIFYLDMIDTVTTSDTTEPGHINTVDEPDTDIEKI
jgi:hypothetical protein